MILPALNEPDLAELAEEVRRDMTFVPVGCWRIIKIALSDNQPGPLNGPIRQDRPLSRALGPAHIAEAIVFYISGHGFGHAHAPSRSSTQSWRSA